jgi:hypothetical protein
MQFAMLLILGGISLVGFAIYYAIVYWYLSIPAIVLLWYYFSAKEEEDIPTEEET